jgi:hypothetical protein
LHGKIHLQKNRGNEALLAEDTSVGEELELATLPVVAHSPARVFLILSVRHGPLFHQLLPILDKHAFIEQEQYDMPPLEALKIDAEYMKALTV